MDSSPFLVKLFIQAPTKEGLVLAQIKNNILNSKRFIYDAPIKDGKNWIAWYFGEFDKDRFVGEQLKRMDEANNGS